MNACGGENFAELALVEGSGLLAENVFARGQSGDGESGVRVRMRGDVDGIKVGGQKVVQRCRMTGNFEPLCKSASALVIATPYGIKCRMWNGAEAVREAGGGAARTDDAEADCLQGLCYSEWLHPETA